MDIYLAARYSRHPEMQRYAAELKAAGHCVTSRWIQGEHEIQEGQDNFRLNQRFAIEDMQDLDDASIAVFFTEETSANGRGRGGRHVEFGIALHSGHRILLVGPRENVFHWLPQVEHFDKWEQALSAIEDFAAEREERE